MSKTPQKEWIYDCKDGMPPWSSLLEAAQKRYGDAITLSQLEIRSVRGKIEENLKLHAELGGEKDNNFDYFLVISLSK